MLKSLSVANIFANCIFLSYLLNQHLVEITHQFLKPVFGISHEDKYISIPVFFQVRTTKIFQWLLG